ncbi:hypothetical protein, partial [Vibrio agarivorans]|uniref:hypothetical protein n=1 Tax=Vibrio agarivorans TaxID=153622 RepID=UPI0035F054EC
HLDSKQAHGNIFLKGLFDMAIMKGLLGLEVFRINHLPTGGFFTSGVYVITTVHLQQAKIAIYRIIAICLKRCISSSSRAKPRQHCKI